MVSSRTKKVSGVSQLGVLFVIASILFLPGVTRAQSSNFKAPSVITLMTYGVTATAYSMYGFLGEAMLDKYGTKLRAIPASNDVARWIPAKEKKAQFVGQGGDIYYITEGLDRYSTLKWGPQPIRVVWFARQPGLVGLVRGDSGIRTCADLKGKRLPWIPGSIFNTFHEAWLAFANLTWNDVIKVPVSGFGGMLRALIDGKIDMAVAAITVPPAYELASSTHGLGYVQLPAADKAGWDRFTKIIPFASPYKATYGPDLSEDHPIECASYAYPATACYDFVDNDTAYFMTKAINECFPEMSKKSELMKRFWSLKGCLELYKASRGYIFHPGSVRYLKEIGVWNSDFDALQAKRLEREKRLAELWKKTVAEAKAKNIDSKDFPKFWLEKHAETFSTLPE
jgi:TRAP transporter TAXI family solute receptor